MPLERESAYIDVVNDVAKALGMPLKGGFVPEDLLVSLNIIAKKERVLTFSVAEVGKKFNDTVAALLAASGAPDITQVAEKFKISCDRGKEIARKVSSTKASYDSSKEYVELLRKALDMPTGDVKAGLEDFIKEVYGVTTTSNLIQALETIKCNIPSPSDLARFESEQRALDPDTRRQEIEDKLKPYFEAMVIEDGGDLTFPIDPQVLKSLFLLFKVPEECL